MHPDRVNKILELSKEYAEKKEIFKCHQMANTPSVHDERIKAIQAYYIAQADMMDAKKRLDRYIEEGK